MYSSGFNLVRSRQDEGKIQKGKKKISAVKLNMYMCIFCLYQRWNHICFCADRKKTEQLTLIIRTALRMSRIPSYTRRDASMNSFSSTGSVGFALKASTADSTCSVNRGMTEEGESKVGGREKQYWWRLTLEKTHTKDARKPKWAQETADNKARVRVVSQTSQLLELCIQNFTQWQRNYSWVNKPLKGVSEASLCSGVTSDWWISALLVFLLNAHCLLLLHKK